MAGEEHEKVTAVDADGVGAALRAARRRRSLSLDDIAQTTKIRVAILRAIEANRREQLPETIYLRGFVRAYAREVGLDPDATAAAYLNQFAPVDAPDASVAGDDSEPADGPLASSAIHRGIGIVARYQWVIIAVAVALIGYAVSRPPRSGPAASPEASQAASATDEARSADTGAAASRGEVGTTGSRASTAADAGVLHFELRFRAPCWLAVTADGNRIVYRLMQAGEQQAFDVHRFATLRVGDAAAVEFSINGAAGRSLGRAGEAVSLRVTADNFRDLLRQ